jgi:cob(I)alamin adenosyltransferase
MTNRLDRITTKTGDNGTTGLGDGTRRDKDSPRIEAIGAVDELNSHIGLVLTEDLPPAVRDCLTAIQHDLFDLGAELAVPDRAILSEAEVARLEKWTGDFNADLPPLQEFILPGGCRAAALCHVARAVCRRAERRYLRLGREELLSQVSQKYLNRLSDLLFVVSRALNRAASVPETLWQPKPRP